MYVVSLLVGVAPLLEFVIRVAPWQPRMVNWRFAAVGILSGVMITPVLAFLLVFAGALLLEQRRTLLIAGVASAVMAAILVLAFIDFTLDFIQLNTMVSPEARRSFLIASLKALLNFSLAIVATTVMGYGMIRTAGEKAAAERGRVGHVAPLIGDRRTS